VPRPSRRGMIFVVGMAALHVAMTPDGDRRLSFLGVAVLLF